MAGGKGRGGQLQGRVSGIHDCEEYTGAVMEQERHDEGRSHASAPPATLHTQGR